MSTQKTAHTQKRNADRPQRRWWRPAWQPRRAKTAGWTRTALSSRAALCSLCTCSMWSGCCSPSSFQTRTGCCSCSLANTWGREEKPSDRNTSHSAGCIFQSLTVYFVVFPAHCGPDHTQSQRRSRPRGHDEEVKQSTKNNWGQLAFAQLPNSADLLWGDLIMTESLTNSVHLQ